MGRSSPTTAAVAGVLLLLAHGEVPQTSAFVPPTAAGALQRLPSRRHSAHSSREREASSLAGHPRQGGAAAANTRTTTAPNNCNLGRPRRSNRSIPTCCAASSSSVDDAGAGPSTASLLASAVSSAAVVEESKEREEGGGVPKVEVGRNATWGGGGGLIPIPVAAGVGTGAGDAGEAGATSGAWRLVGTSLKPEFEWEDDAGAAWTEFEDWLVQDTYSRYAIGSGKYVLWRRMVREVPELMERTPQEARQRWLRLTGRLGGGINGEGGREEEGGNRAPGSPALDTFYVQPPVLEQWEEIVEGDGIGSFRGNVFGQRGLADGTAMTTAPVDVSGRKIQDQYVATQCGVVYELGEKRETDMVGQASSKMLEIAPATVLALAGAFYALTALSHHVQVEVFVI